MKKLVHAFVLTIAVGANFFLPGFVASVEAAKCRLATPPKGLKRAWYVQGTHKGLKYQFSDRPGWIYARHPKKGWVVLKCF